MDSEKAEFPVLTGIRALAAGLVFLHHFVNIQDDSYPFFIRRIAAELHIGVSLFFVLSGFLITHRYGNLFRENLRFYPTYLFSRFARIYPLYLLLTVLFLAIEPLRKEISFANWLLEATFNLTFLKGFFSSLIFSGLPQTWSLCLEVCFYALAPFLFIGFLNRMERLLPVIFSLLILCFALSFHQPDFRNFLLNFTFAGRSFEFFTGCFLASYFSGKTIRPKDVFWITLTGISGILISLGALIYLGDAHQTGDQHSVGWAINNLLLPIFIALMMKGLLTEKSFLCQMLSSRLLRFLGKISYAFFLLQIGVFQLLIGYFAGNSLFVNYVLLNVLAAVFCYGFELPVQKMLLNRFGSVTKSNPGSDKE